MFIANVRVLCSDNAEAEATVCAALAKVAKLATQSAVAGGVGCSFSVTSVITPNVPESDDRVIWISITQHALAANKQPREVVAGGDFACAAPGAHDGAVSTDRLKMTKVREQQICCRPPLDTERFPAWCRSEPDG
jgi:hypothetical protein